MTTGKTELLGWNCETPVQGRLLDWQPCLADKAGKADCRAEFVGIHASQHDEDCDDLEEIHASLDRVWELTAEADQQG